MRWRWWRLSVESRLDMIPLPRVRYENQGPDFRWASFTLGTRWSDPILSFEVNLDESQVTRLVTTAPAMQVKLQIDRTRLLLTSAICALRSRSRPPSVTRTVLVRPSGSTAREEEGQNQACGVAPEHSP